VGALSRHGLAALDALNDDKSLRDLWLQGRGPGLTDTQRLLCTRYRLRGAARSKVSTTWGR
jgi:hypothetical protein